MSQIVETPVLADEIALAEAEDFASLQKDIATGRLDTASLGDIPEGDYPVDIIEASVREAKGKDGELRYPNVAFRLRAKDDSFTTTAYWSISAASPKARKFIGERLSKTFMRLLGPAFKTVTPEEVTDPTDILNVKVRYYNKLAGMLAGKSAVAKISKNDNGYMQLDALASAGA